MQHAYLEMAQMISDLKQALWMNFCNMIAHRNPRRWKIQEEICC
jgi:hypothetical protein